MYLRNLSCFLIWIVTFVSLTILAVFLFRLLRLYLAQFQLCSYLDRYVCILRNFNCFLIWIVTFVSCAILSVFFIWIVTFVSCAILAVFLFGLLPLYLAQFKLFSYLDCYVYILHNFSCFLIWIVTFVSSANLAVFLFGLLRLYLLLF